MISIGGSIIYTNIYDHSKESDDFVNALFTFVERINCLRLSDEEMALFTAAIVINPKRHGLTETDKIASIHKRIIQCLQCEMQRGRPNDPSLCQDLISNLNDLWILNGMHTKLNPKLKSGIMKEDSDRMCPESSKDTFFRQAKCPVKLTGDKIHGTDDVSTSPTSNYSQDEEMQSPGSADSGCSVDSGCSAESDISYDSGYSVSCHSGERYSGMVQEEELNDSYKKLQIKRKTNSSNPMDSRDESDNGQSLTWHKPQKHAEKKIDSPVLRSCLEGPSTLKMENFCSRNSVNPHPHKKFRPAIDRASYTHETLEFCNSPSLSTTSPSPSCSTSPSPSSSISSSPSRVSSSPYSSFSNPSSPGSSSILAHRLAMPIKRNSKTSTLLQSLTQEPKFGSDKTFLSDTLHDCIMNGQTKVQRQHVMAAPSPSRYDDIRNLSPYSTSPPHSMTNICPSSLSQHNNSSPYRYSSPPLTPHIPPAHSPPSETPTGLGASAMSGCMSPTAYISEDAQPLNLSTKTPSPPPAIEA